VLEMAERVLYNLQKGIVDNSISTAAGLKGVNSQHEEFVMYVDIDELPDSTRNTRV